MFYHVPGRESFSGEGPTSVMKSAGNSLELCQPKFHRESPVQHVLQIGQKVVPETGPSASQAGQVRVI